MIVVDWVLYIIGWGLLLYAIFLFASYFFIAYCSIAGIKSYLRKRSVTDYRLIATSDMAPRVSILAPAYNEGATIVENVRSLLSIHYNNLELVVINDGSKDDSLQKLIDTYDLYKAEHYVQEKIKAKNVRGIYKSRNPVYHKLIVVDKENGGKADALNVGVNVSSNDYILCIDVDCILVQDTLLKIIKPFLESSNGERIIASGGAVRIANSCEIENGRLKKVNLPRNFLARIQSLEYIRAFLLGRMAWSHINGLLLVSGAFGIFDKEIVIKCGGYNHNTVGEDMELIVRMRRYMMDRKLPHRVIYIPDPLCWTEAPESYEILGRQRNRWTRGTMEVLWTHRRMFFNHRYGILGLLSLPFWFLYEYFAPILETIGWITFGIIAIKGDFLMYYVYLIAFVIFFNFTFSVFAILMEVATFNQYKKPSEVLKLIGTAAAEPFVYHPFTVWSALKGNIDLIRRKNSWGEMTRKGFVANSNGQSAATEPKIPIFKQLIQQLTTAFSVFAAISLAWLLIIIGLSSYEFILDGLRHQFPERMMDVGAQKLFSDLLFWLKGTLCMCLPFTLISFLSLKLARTFYIAVVTLLSLGQLILTNYFITALSPLGADLYGYALIDIKQTLVASGSVNIQMIVTILAGTFVAWLLLQAISARIKVNRWVAAVAPLLSLGVLFSGFSGIKHAPQLEYISNLTLNKTGYFIGESVSHFLPAKETDILNAKKVPDNFSYVNEQQYPFLHVDSTADVLTPFFNLKSEKPNVVILLVEGLGRAYTNEGAYLGNFTPFIDSLSKQSLYWENFLSTGGRTFAVLPSVLGSLPFLEKGFLEAGEKMPEHLSLLSLLKLNDYQTSFYYGGYSHFDNMNTFLRKNNIDEIHDMGTFPEGYTWLPKNSEGFSWGYNDKELYRLYLNTKKETTKPQLSVLLTISSHSPFLINEQETYNQRFEQRLTELQFDEKSKKEHRNYKAQYTSILYTDDAIKGFFEGYAKRADFNNTIFLITGDHRMSEIPQSTTIDRFHVPLIIYSPLLKRSAKFDAVSTHFDITPSLLAFLAENYSIKKPSLVSWIGKGLDTTRQQRNNHAYPIMFTKNTLYDFVAGDYHLNKNTLFKVLPDMNEVEVENQHITSQLKSGFNQFKMRNNRVINGAKLLPDSIYNAYFPTKK
ncbi:sulfatase-like hydrolase/transferase [Solitalea longa]|uniref:sulfatase-like hydrolase/transferase n=1 Tax=Solitalea longa TaxID=2079460 RepID=UPI0013FE0568|nr:sulfatase-like hydrolase/transferase [Solitalea longa]